MRRNQWRFGDFISYGDNKKMPKMPAQRASHWKAGNWREANMRQRDLLEFRTPQHPSSFGLPSNNWGGASPLLARNIPKESLEQKYLRLNTTRDEIFPAADDEFNNLPKSPASKQQCPPTPSGSRTQFILKFLFTPKRKTAAPAATTTTLGSNLKKKSWFPRLDPQKRWPQGW